MGRTSNQGRGPKKATASPAPPSTTAAEPERLQKLLARAGIGSRRACDEMIRDGRVTVDGRVASLGERIDPTRSRVEVDGVPVPLDPELRYFALNKPSGVVTTARDPQGRTDISGFVPPGPRVFSVGRLDRETEGLLLLTNDGELANRVMHPRYGMEKEYLVEVEGTPSDRTVARLARGIELEDGMATPRSVRKVGRSGERVALRIVMAEGRKREVRRMLAAVGLSVSRLVRVRVGPVRLGGLRPGEIRPLELSEVRALMAPPRSTRGRSGARP